MYAKFSNTIYLSTKHEKETCFEAKFLSFHYNSISIYTMNMHYTEVFYTYQGNDFKLSHKFKGIQYKCSNFFIPYQVHTCPDLVRARENWAPHSIWHTF